MRASAGDVPGFPAATTYDASLLLKPSNPALRLSCDGVTHLLTCGLFLLRLPVCFLVRADDEGVDDHGQGHADEAHRAAPHHVVGSVAVTSVDVYG